MTRRFRRGRAACLTVLALAALARPARAADHADEAPPTNPSEPLELTLDAAVRRGLEHNLRLLAREQQARVARGQRIASRGGG